MCNGSFIVDANIAFFVMFRLNRFSTIRYVKKREGPL